MGGKTWQQDEEELFWLELIPQSPEGLDPALRKYSWREVAQVMHERMGPKGYRNYNHQLIYEHFYQNCKSNHPSPRAKGFVKDYMQRRGDKPIERPKGPKSCKDKAPVKRRTASDDAGPSGSKRARHGSEDVQLPAGSASPAVSNSRLLPMSSSCQGDVVHAASQTTPFEGTTTSGYWPRRVPLPLAPRVGYGVQNQATIGHSCYPESPTPINAQDRAFMFNHGTLSVLPTGSVHQDGDTLATATGPPNRLPVTLEPRFDSPGPGNFRSNGTRTPLPSIRSLMSNGDAARPPRLAGLITPKHHGAMFDALLSVASGSSAEPSPNSIFSRSESFNNSRADSPATTIIDDNSAEAVTPDRCKAAAQCPPDGPQEATAE